MKHILCILILALSFSMPITFEDDTYLVCCRPIGEHELDESEVPSLDWLSDVPTFQLECFICPDDMRDRLEEDFDATYTNGGV
jgi:hypothetical protein